MSEQRESNGTSVAFVIDSRSRCVRAVLGELQYAIVPPLHQFSLQKCAFRDTRTTLIFVRLVERMRRAIAHEYGLPLASVLPCAGVDRGWAAGAALGSAEV